MISLAWPAAMSSFNNRSLLSQIALVRCISLRSISEKHVGRIGKSDEIDHRPFGQALRHEGFKHETSRKGPDTEYHPPGFATALMYQVRLHRAHLSRPSPC